MCPVIEKDPLVDERRARLARLRHSCSHLMAEAVLKLWPGTKLAIGPSIEEGFYYDFDVEGTITDEDLPRIEDKMRELAASGVQFERVEVGRDEAKKMIADDGTYKAELLDAIPDGESISFYRSGDFTDLCAGPHIESTSELRHFKLLSVSGAYWRGDERNKMLTRIYGTCFDTRGELKQHMKYLAEAERRDHRKLGRELDLFGIYPDLGPGLPVYHPKGAVMMKILQDYMWEEHERRGYIPLMTPHIMRTEAWETSGHMSNYRDNMFMVTSLDETERMEKARAEGRKEAKDFGSYGLKPMNCPMHLLVYKNGIRSYRDLPIRMFEFGTVYRYERGGVLHGLLRVRGFTQDDAHIFCTPEQFGEESRKVLEFCFDVYDLFGFEYTVGLKTMPDKAIGDPDVWEMATEGLHQELKNMGIPFHIGEKDGAFYGPKVDIDVRDSLGREWQGSTVQVDFNLPERFDLNYIAQDGSRQRPVMVHRAILGSFERFFGLMIEEFAGAFPLWIAPVQVMVLPIGEAHRDFARSLRDKLVAAGFRVGVDESDEKLGKKIRTHKIQKIPYLAVIGDKEMDSGDYAINSYFEGDIGKMNESALTEMLADEVKAKTVRKR
ncbi:threonine--tRNA ligase [bacterium]|nr:threonine--tRNA ligase [bacterium]